MHFMAQWKAVLCSLLSVATLFIAWDVWFTLQGVWGFNPDYLVGINLWNLPIEEWMFFILIPFSSLFIHYALHYFYPQIMLHPKATLVITWSLIVIAFSLAIFNMNKAYTFINFAFLTFILLLGIWKGRHLLSRFYLSFLIILIPFFIVNGILTGSFIDNEVVWYNNEENLGIRLFTIPVEDVGYAFSMIFLNVYFIEKFRKWLKLPALKTKN